MRDAVQRLPLQLAHEALLLALPAFEDAAGKDAVAVLDVARAAGEEERVGLPVGEGRGRRVERDRAGDDVDAQSGHVARDAHLLAVAEVRRDLCVCLCTWEGGKESRRQDERGEL